MIPETTFYNSPLGILKISASGNSITAVTFLNDKSENVELQTDSGTGNEVLAECVNQLDAYFEGKLQAFSLSCLQGGTVFQQKVWDELDRIPFGKTISYLELSKKLGNSKVIRAAASANGRNSLAIIVPCHRVIGSNGSLVGYAGELWRKKWLLNHEAKFAHGVQSLF